MSIGKTGRHKDIDIWARWFRMYNGASKWKQWLEDNHGLILEEMKKPRGTRFTISEQDYAIWHTPVELSLDKNEPNG
jgi:hypothetical protein